MIKKNRLFIFLVMFIISGCSDDKNTPETISVKTQPKSILLITKSLTNPFFVAMQKGAQKAANEFDFNLIIRSGANETSIEQQINLVQEGIEDKVDAIVIAPADSIKIIPILKKAQQQGIKIINIDNQVDSDSIKKIGMQALPFISVDNKQGAYLSASVLVKKAPPHSTAIIIEGIRSADNSKLRTQGALKAFKAANIPVVAIESAQWKMNTAYHLLQVLQAKYPQVNLIFCANDMMAMGVLKYLEEKQLNNILVAGYDDIPDVKPMIKSGKLQATVNQRADLQGYYGALFAYQQTIGKTVPLNKKIDIQLITTP